MSDSGKDSQAHGEEIDFYRKVLEWKISEESDDEEQEEEDEEAEEDSAYISIDRSSFQSELSSSNELTKEKVPPLHLIPGEKYDCSISRILSPLRFRLRRNDEEFYKLTR